jgi:hypothetical protein
MKKIVSVIKPFVINQNVFVYEDGNKIDVLSVSLNDIQNILVNTATQYEVTDIELIGSKKYLNGIVNKIKETEMSQYNEHKLNINIING